MPDGGSLREGMRFGASASYRLDRRIGSGGMGQVWLARRITLGGHVQRVAVKVPHEADQAGDVNPEALRMARLSHDNIVPFVDSGRLPDGRPFVAMAHVDGVDLDGLRRRAGMERSTAYGQGIDGRIPDPIVGFVLFMVLRALDHAHTFDFGDGVRGLVHRDVSPGNVLLDEAQGFVKLTDFGAAALIEGTGGSVAFAGKLPYLAPEVMAGEAATVRSDLFSLGVVGYELLTGFHPHLHPDHLRTSVGATTQQLLAFERPLLPPHHVIEGVDSRLALIVADLLSPDPAARPGSADEALRRVGAALFDRGFGPTTTSLAAYLRLLGAPDGEPAAGERSHLRFLLGEDMQIHVRSPWKLTPAARESLAAGRCPARGAAPGSEVDHG
jgi:serine/threonine protein kinase